MFNDSLENKNVLLLLFI